MQKILIYLLNRKAKLQTTRILRSSLKNYVQVYKTKSNRSVWINKKSEQQVKKKLFRTRGYRKATGTTELLGKQYVRFRFPLWRPFIYDQVYVDRLMEKLVGRFKRVKDLHKNLIAQRIGLSISTEKPTYDTFVNSKTKRKNKKEIVDLISTGTYERGDRSTIAMFDDLKRKIISYIYKTLSSPSLLDEKEEKTAKEFFVFYSEQ